MSTSAFLLYVAPSGELRGTTIAGMGYSVPDQLFERFGKDYEALVNFIERGRAFGGYRRASDEQAFEELHFDAKLEDAEEVSTEHNLTKGAHSDVVWKVDQNGDFEIVNLVRSYTIEAL